MRKPNVRVILTAQTRGIEPEKAVTKIDERESLVMKFLPQVTPQQGNQLNEKIDSNDAMAKDSG